MLFFKTRNDARTFKMVFFFKTRNDAHTFKLENSSYEVVDYGPKALIGRRWAVRVLNC